MTINIKDYVVNTVLPGLAEMGDTSQTLGERADKNVKPAQLELAQDNAKVLGETSTEVQEAVSGHEAGLGQALSGGQSS